MPRAVHVRTPALASGHDHACRPPRRPRRRVRRPAVRGRRTGRRGSRVGSADAGRGLGRARPDQPPGLLRRCRAAGHGRPGWPSPRWSTTAGRHRRSHGCPSGAGAGPWAATSCSTGGGAPTGRWSRLRAADPSDRVPWFGPPMGALSFVSARLMETWAHGQDVCDALGVERVPTDRLRHIAHLGVRARPFSYVVRGRDVPAGSDRRGPGRARTGTSGGGRSARRPTPGRRRRRTRRSRARPSTSAWWSPSGATWPTPTWWWTGDLAEDWMSIAQAFAGPPGPGRPPPDRRSPAGQAGRLPPVGTPTGPGPRAPDALRPSARPVGPRTRRRPPRWCRTTPSTARPRSSSSQT